ncbi:RNA polymerase sigma factor [Clostridia bacterium]|nr:RNA polymerase sigma factor [Clostridia bacterium]GHV32655.1 RNA polymerase sigma factor [Clostridia bacterium]
MKTIDEIFLIAKAKRGDKNALGLLIESYYDNIYKYIVRRTGNTQIAPDLTQDVFLKLTASIGGYKFTGKFSNFVFTIAVNICNDYFRRKKPDYEDVDSLKDERSENAPEKRLLESEAAAVIRRGLDELSDTQRETVVLRYYHNMKVKDIAQVTNVSVSTAKSRLKQSVDKLKRYIDKEGYFE